MRSDPLRDITPEEIETYREEGVVLLKGLFDREWVEFLRDAIEEDMAKPTGINFELAKDQDPGRFFADTYMWHRVPAFETVVRNSPAGEVAGRIMGARHTNIVFDQILVKEPGTAEKTTWHQDLPYWPILGSKVCTLWLALDEVTKESGAVEYVAGSHLWGKRYHPIAFIDPEKYQTDLPRVPDIEAMRGELTIRQPELEPGDCTIHHGLLVHGAPGNATSDKRRRGYVTRWAGEDVVYDPRPNIQPMLEDPDIPPGAPLDSALWPRVWERQAA